VIDILLLLMIVGAGVLGWRRGLAVSALAGIAFLIAGLPLSAIAAAIGTPPPAAAFMLGGLLGLVPFALKLELVTEHVEAVLGDGTFRLMDRVAGALLNVFVAACIGWFVAALATIAPGDTPALSAMRSSSVFGSLVEAVPPQGTLGAVVLRSGLIPSLNGPLVLAEDPDPASATMPAVLAARGSVLQVRSTACNRLVTGTGWVAGAGIVVTNAHVVAGSQRSFLAGGPRYAGAASTVTAFDPVNDIAVLVLDQGQSVQLPPILPITPRVQHGEPGAVIGFPLGGEQTVEPARIDRVASYDVEPLGGGPVTSAEILAFRAKVRPGNSGGPLVAEDGSVLGLVVAKALGQRTEAAYGVPSRDLLRAVAQGSARQPASTGRCLEEADLTTETS
jgi:S1-C subfamily serine protease